ncbi:MAG: type II secretion system protein [Bdellovibrionaceae bacterium]|nr:type II secretion system protein [Pseudobdellovibrionaceae bacterium]
MKDTILTNKAFNLIELMIAVSILGIISVSIATGFTSLFQQKEQFVTESEVHNIQSAISTYLYNTASCSKEFSNKNLPGVVWKNLTLTRYKGFGDWEGVLKSGANLGKMKIKELSIRKKPGTLTDSFNDGSVSYKIYIIQIKIQFKLKHLSSKLFSPFYIELPVFTKFPYNKIDSCYAGTKLPYFCSALGLRYKQATHSCVPQHRCLLKGFFTVERCERGSRCKKSGAARVNPITQGYSCPLGVSPTLIGSYENNYRESCGKKCSRSVERRIKSYLCMKCN